MAIIKYERGSDGVVRESKSNDGGKTYTDTGANSGNGYKANNSSGSGKVTSGNTGTSKQGYSSGWNDYTGNTGKKYSVSGSNGTITVNRTDGTSATVRPTDVNYAATLKAMQEDGVNYTPNHTFTNQNGTYSTKDYTSGNKDLQYALEQAAKASGNGTTSTADYVKSLYNRIGTTRSDGTTVTVEDVNRELNRLGLSDYNSSNGIYTASGNLLPGNSFVGQHTGSDGSNSANSLWYNYGGQDYLAGANGGDSSDWSQYVNGKTGNLDNLSYIFGNMANNQYAQQDSDFLNAYLNAQNNFNAISGNQAGNGNSLSNYWNSLNQYNNTTGNSNSSSLLELLQEYLNSGLQANQDFLAEQKAQAETSAEQQARSAYVNHVQANRAMNEMLSAQGLGTSGAVQSAQLGLQSDYGDNLNSIQQNLNTMLSSLSQQKLQALSDYYNNMSQYAYQVSNDEANRALQQAQLALQQQQAAYDQEYQRQQLAFQQAQYEYNKKLQQGSLYSDMYNNGSLSDAGLYNALNDLGLISNGYFANGSYTDGSTTGQLQRQLAQAELQNQILANQKLRSSL